MAGGRVKGASRTAAQAFYKNDRTLAEVGRTIPQS
jgi:hypothetical protein